MANLAGITVARSHEDNSGNTFDSGGMVHRPGLEGSTVDLEFLTNDFSAGGITQTVWPLLGRKARLINSGLQRGGGDGTGDPAKHNLLTSRAADVVPLAWSIAGSAGGFAPVSVSWPVDGQVNEAVAVSTDGSTGFVATPPSGRLVLRNVALSIQGLDAAGALTGAAATLGNVSEFALNRNFDDNSGYVFGEGGMVHDAGLENSDLSVTFLTNDHSPAGIGGLIGPLLGQRARMGLTVVQAGTPNVTGTFTMDVAVLTYNPIEGTAGGYSGFTVGWPVDGTVAGVFA